MDVPDLTPQSVASGDAQALRLPQGLAEALTSLREEAVRHLVLEGELVELAQGLTIRGDEFAFSPAVAGERFSAAVPVASAEDYLGAGLAGVAHTHIGRTAIASEGDIGAALSLTFTEGAYMIVVSHLSGRVGTEVTVFYRSRGYSAQDPRTSGSGEPSTHQEAATQLAERAAPLLTHYYTGTLEEGILRRIAP